MYHQGKPAWLVQTLADLERHESFRQFAYPDPLSVLGKKYQGRQWNWGFEPGDILLERYKEEEKDGRPWTVGHGFTKGVKPSSRISKQKSTEQLEDELLEHVKCLDDLVPGWELAPLYVSTVLANMAYNLGAERLSKFAPTLELFKKGMYEDAAKRLRKSLWFKQTKTRAEELCQRLENHRIEPRHLVVDTALIGLQCVYQGEL